MLLCEYLINGITEISPANVATLLGSTEVLNEFLEFVARKHDLSHVQADAELTFGDEA